MTRLSSRPINLPCLTNQIAALTETGRGAVVEKSGAGKSARYRFVDPLLEPYVLMRGLEAGWATAKTPRWLPGADPAAETEIRRAA